MINKLYSILFMLSIITLAHGADHNDSLTRTINSSYADRKTEHRRQCEIAQAAVATMASSLAFLKTPEYITFHENKRSGTVAMPFVVERTTETDAVMLVGFAEGKNRAQAEKHALKVRRYVEQQLYAHAHIARISRAAPIFNFEWNHWAHEIMARGTRINYVHERVETTDVHENITTVVYGPGTPCGLSRVTLHIEPYLAAVQQRLKERKAMHASTAGSCFSQCLISMPGPKLYYDAVYVTQPAAFRHPSGDTVHHKLVDAILIATPYEKSASIIARKIRYLVTQECGTTYDMHQLIRDAIQSACPLTGLVEYTHYRYYPCSRNNSSEDNPFRLVVIQQKLDKALEFVSPWETDLYKRAQALATFASNYDAHGTHHRGLILIPDIAKLEKFATTVTPPEMQPDTTQMTAVDDTEQIALDEQLEDCTTVYDDKIC